MIIKIKTEDELLYEFGEDWREEIPWNSEDKIALLGCDIQGVITLEQIQQLRSGQRIKLKKSLPNSCISYWYVEFSMVKFTDKVLVPKKKLQQEIPISILSSIPKIDKININI